MGLYCNFEFLHLFCFQMKRLLEGVVMTIPKWTVLGMATQTVMRTLWIVKKKTHSSEIEPAFFVIFFCGGWDQSWLQTYIWATQRSQSTSAPYFPSTLYQCCQYAQIILRSQILEEQHCSRGRGRGFVLYETDELPSQLGRLCFSQNSLTSLQVVRVPGDLVT